MTVKSKPKTRRERFTSWRKKRKYGAEMTHSEVWKFETLDRILRKDMDDLGIKQMSILIEPMKTKSGATIHLQALRIKGKEKKIFPVVLIFNYRSIQNLSMEELRSIAWHEFGHFIFGYYYPGITKYYARRHGEHMVEETFANEFAYRRFGDIFVQANKKQGKAVGLYKFHQTMEIDEVKKMEEYIKQHGYGYWKKVAKDFGISVEYNPKKTIMVGIKPGKNVLGNLR